MSAYYLHDNGTVDDADECGYGGCEPRPVVVIDPEDREQVERLRDATRNFIAEWEADLTSYGDLASAMQAALRSLLAPDKPAEPQGLGAVVEDAEGRIYTRYDRHYERPWYWDVKDDRVVRRFGWDEIAAVKVLSEGVTS